MDYHILCGIGLCQYLMCLFIHISSLCRKISRRECDFSEGVESVGLRHLYNMMVRITVLQNEFTSNEKRYRQLPSVLRIACRQLDRLFAITIDYCCYDAS